MKLHHLSGRITFKIPRTKRIVSKTMLCNFLDHLARSIRSVTLPSLEKYSSKSRHHQNEYTYAIIEQTLFINFIRYNKTYLHSATIGQVTLQNTCVNLSLRDIHGQEHNLLNFSALTSSTSRFDDEK